MPRGRTPKPTAVKKAEGNPGKRALNAAEPALSPLSGADLEPPAHLTEDAITEWNRLAPELLQKGVLTIADRAALAGYCQAWADWVSARKEIDTNGMVTTTPKGFEVQSPWLGIANRAMDRMIKIANEFGFTPASRSRVHAEPPKTAEDDLENKLFGGK
jgi:P27 family predicted phage terminase small subunit